MKKSVWVGLALGAALLISGAPKASAEEANDRNTLPRHNEFMRLPFYEQKALIKALRELMKHVEKGQAQTGLNYEEARLKMGPSLFALLLESAEAAEPLTRSMALSCVYGGRFSVYFQPPPSLCRNDWPCDAPGGKGIFCNPLLFGKTSKGADVCARANSRATWNCEEQASKAGIGLDDVVNYVKQHESEWNEFVDQFEVIDESNPNKSLCARLFADKLKRDPNYTTCEKMYERLRAIRAKLGLRAAQPAPAPAPQAAPAVQPAPPSPAPAPQPAQAATAPQKNCDPRPFTTEYRSNDLRINSNLFDELMVITADSCRRVKNDSEQPPVERVSINEMIRRFGRCTKGNYANSAPLSGKDAAIFKKLQAGNLQQLQELAGGRWYNDANQAFERHFGLPIQEARAILCRPYDKTNGPDLGRLAGDGTSQVRSAHGEAWSTGSGGDVVSGTPVGTSQAQLRQALRECIAKNWNDEDAKTKTVFVVPPDCPCDDTVLPDGTRVPVKGSK